MPMTTIEAVAVTAAIIGVASGLLWLTARYEQRLGWFAEGQQNHEPPLRLLLAPPREATEERSDRLTGTDDLRAVPIRSGVRSPSATARHSAGRALGPSTLAVLPDSEPEPHQGGAQEQESPDWSSDFAHFDPESSKSWLRIEEFRDGSEVVLRAELPDCDPDNDVEVTVTGATLRIQAQRRPLGDATRHTDFRSEFRYGSFTRSFALPERSRPEDVKATYDKGILEIRIPLMSPCDQDLIRSVPVTTGRS